MTGRRTLRQSREARRCGRPGWAASGAPGPTGERGSSERVIRAWLVVGLASTSSIKFPFPRGPIDSSQAFFNVVHAALLGYEAVTCAAIVALLAYVIVRPRGRARRP